MSKDQAPDVFDRQTWAALAAIGDHFAAMGGGAQYAGYHQSHPAMLVGLLLLAVGSDRNLLTEVVESADASKLDAAWAQLAAQSPEVEESIKNLQPGSRRRFPAKLLLELCAILQGLVVARADMGRYFLLAEQRLSQPLPTYWRAMTQHVLGQ